MEDNKKIEEQALPTENEVKPADSAELSVPKNESSSIEEQPKVSAKKRESPIAKIKNFVSGHPVGTATAVAAIITIAKMFRDMYELGKDTPCENSTSAPVQSSSAQEISDTIEESNEFSTTAFSANSYISQEQIPAHRRNLPKGQHASEAKIKQAEAEGNPLQPGQTSVDGYPRERTIHKK